MGKKISSYIDKDLHQLIEAMAEHHDIPMSRVIELLLREGVQARDMRYRHEQLDAKLDVLIESLGGEPVAEDAARERFEAVSDRELPAGVSGVELADMQLPYFQSAGALPDRSAEEQSIERVLAELKATTGDGDTAD